MIRYLRVRWHHQFDDEPVVILSEIDNGREVRKADLSAYAYLPSRQSMVNIGWLGAGHPFTTGHVPADTVRALMLLAADQHNIMRGV